MRLLAIVGPTASGKTRLAVRVAHRLGSEILSADSRQLYRGLDLGSGKDLSEYRAVSPPVPVHLIDLAEPDHRFSVFSYQSAAWAVLAGLQRVERYASGQVPLLLVGGSGLYVEAILSRYRIADVPADPELRERLSGRERQELESMLRREAPEIASRTDLSSRRRIVRALEIAAASGRGPIEHSSDPGIAIDHRIFAIELPREQLRDRIRRRLAARLDAGLIAEVLELRRRGIGWERLQELGLEYRFVAAHLRGEISRKELEEQLGRAIGRFAKRQETWFRGFERRGLPVRWIGPDDVEAVVTASREWCGSPGPDGKLRSSDVDEGATGR